jgi:hypothetical protein
MYIVVLHGNHLRAIVDIGRPHCQFDATTERRLSARRKMSNLHLSVSSDFIVIFSFSTCSSFVRLMCVALAL